jgi:sugar lactone lactonase YvrE
MRKHTVFLAAAIASLATIATASPTLLVTGTTQVFHVDAGGIATQFVSGLTNARGITMGPDGNIYVADYGAGDVKKYDGSSGASLGTFVSGLSNPYDVQFKDGTAYVSEWGAGDVKTFDSAGTATGTFVSGLNHASDFVWDDAGNFYISSSGNHTVEKFDSAGNSLGTYLDLNGYNSGFASPRDLIFHGGLLYVADSVSVNGSGGFLYIYNGTDAPTVISTGGGTNVRGLLFGSDDGLLYGADSGNGRVAVLDTVNGGGSLYSAVPSANYMIEVNAPEPGTLAMLGLGAAFMALRFRKKTTGR